MRVSSAHGHPVAELRLSPGERETRHWRLQASHGWYDLTVEADGDSGFRQQIAGHVETGADSMSDPVLGA